MQARFALDAARITGRSSTYVRIADGGDDRRAFKFCPQCGATVYYTTSGEPDLIAVPVGAFADPTFPAPSVSVWESRKHPWVTLPDAVEHHA